MHRFRYLLVFAVAATLVGCDALGSDDMAVLSGTVVNAETSRPLTGATVQVLGMDVELSSDSLGAFEASVDVDSTAFVEIIAFKTGYEADTVLVTVEAGQALTVPALQLQPTTGDDGTSGPAASITLAPRSSASIGVSETGAQETASLVFVARDADDRPVDNANAVDIAVSIINGPGGGEFLSPAAPATVRTNENGEATVTLTSGTAAGVVQIETVATVGDRQIRSQPITLVIHGGFPNQDHMTVATQKRNYPGLGIQGLEIGVTALVGDRYANPVQAGTQVYFTTDSGVIQGSAPTGANGQASATLLTGNPYPADGWATITARTSGIDGERVEESTRVLLTGVPTIVLYTAGMDLGSYVYEVKDPNGNPLSEGTSINVSVEGTNVKTRGQVQVNLGDIVGAGPGRTQFEFSIGVADTESEESPSVDEIKISVTGPNGNVEGTRPGNLGPGVVIAGRRRQ